MAVAVPVRDVGIRSDAFPVESLHVGNVLPWLGLLQGGVCPEWKLQFPVFEGTCANVLEPPDADENHFTWSTTLTSNDFNTPAAAAAYNALNACACGYPPGSCTCTLSGGSCAAHPRMRRLHLRQLVPTG